MQRRSPRSQSILRSAPPKWNCFLRLCFTSLGLLLLPRGYLGVAPPLSSRPFLPRIMISAINYRGIPPRYREAVNHRRKARWRLLRTIEVVKSAAIPREENFQLNLSPKFKQQLASSLCTNSTALHSLAGQTVTRERVWSNSQYCILSSRAANEVGVNINWDVFCKGRSSVSLNSMPKRQPRASIRH